MKKPIIFFAVILLGLSNNYLQAQDSRYKAQYLINLTNYMNWSDEEITIGVYGSSPIFEELAKLIPKDSEIRIVQVTEDKTVSSCDMIFLPGPQSYNFNKIQKLIGQSSIVIVAENEDLISKGAEMAFFKENDKLKFAVSQSAIDDSGIVISPKFIARGVRVLD